MRNTPLANGEIYHVYNRGVDKRDIFIDRRDFERFFTGIKQFNTPYVLGSLTRGHRVSTEERLVEIIAYCVNPNHFHFILKQTGEKGIEKFMHKLGMGYAKYFNTRHARSGTLFQGKFGARHIDSNEYLLHVSAYVNLNNKIGAGNSEFSQSSWSEYVEDSQEKLCATDIILSQFEDREKYRTFAEDALKSIRERKLLLEELEQ